MSKETMKSAPSTYPWIESVSSKYNRPFWFNELTNESVWEKPSSIITEEEGISSSKRSECSSSRNNEQTTKDSNESSRGLETSKKLKAFSPLDPRAVLNSGGMNCDPALHRSRNFLFRGVNQRNREAISMDEVLLCLFTLKYIVLLNGCFFILRVGGIFFSHRESCCGYDVSDHQA